MRCAEPIGSFRASINSVRTLAWIEGGTHIYVARPAARFDSMLSMPAGRNEDSPMKLHGSITINGKAHAKGSEVAWYYIYPFFLFHMLLFGASGFFMAYGESNPNAVFLYAHGGIAITVYIVFYFAIFGVDEVKWMFINAALGVLGIYTQIAWLLSVFDRSIDEYPLHIHVVPFLYFVLYTFLIRQAFLDILGAREDEERKKFVDGAYVVVSVAISLAFWFLERR